MTRMAISPRLAIRILRNAAMGSALSENGVSDQKLV
jgi:hypothetical protein